MSNDIELLEKTYEIMETLLLNCFAEDDEDKTFEQIEKLAKEIKKTCHTDFELQALDGALYRLKMLSFPELNQVYHSLKEEN